MSRTLVWMGASLKDLKDLPVEVRLEIGHGLREAQDGAKAKTAKPMKGEGYSASVLEIVANYKIDTYRCVYTVKFEEAIYGLEKEHEGHKDATEGNRHYQCKAEGRGGAT